MEKWSKMSAENRRSQSSNYTKVIGLNDNSSIERAVELRFEPLRTDAIMTEAEVVNFLLSFECNDQDN